MKTILANTGRFLGLSMAGLLAFLAPVSDALSQPASPVGVWDCVMTGNGQDGILFLNFTDVSDDATGLPVFEGLFIQAGHKKVQSGRSSSTGNNRGGTSSAGTFTNLFGGGFINGSAQGVAVNIGPEDWLEDSRGNRGTWFFDSKGQTVGSFYTVLNASAHATNFFSTCIDQPVQVPLTNGGVYNFEVAFCFTNPVFITNYPWSAPDGETGFTNLTFTNFNFIVGSVGITNNVSFVGKVIPGKRLTMVGTSAFGKFTIRGVPLTAVSTILPVDGFYWTGTKTESNYKFVEEFFLTPTGIPNYYGVTGQGPSYTYNLTNSICLISSQKRIGFSINENGFGSGSAGQLKISRATFGKLTNTQKTIGTKGQGDSASDLDVIKFDANLSPFPLP